MPRSPQLSPMQSLVVPLINDIGAMSEAASFLVRSRDSGHSWEGPVTIAEDCIETALSDLGGGT